MDYRQALLGDVTAPAWDAYSGRAPWDYMAPGRESENVATAFVPDKGSWLREQAQRWLLGRGVEPETAAKFAGLHPQGGLSADLAPGVGMAFGLSDMLNPQKPGDTALAAAGLVPGAKQAKGATSAALAEFERLASTGKIRQAASTRQDLTNILKKSVPATDFDINSISHPLARDYEFGTLKKKLDDAGLHVADDRMGRVFVGTTPENLQAIQSAKTPYQYGKAYGYSDADIAKFYLQRSGGNANLAYQEFAADAAAAVPEVKAGIRAYHGSPHSFERFDLSKIGTGEGAQAYGHGLYFAENEGVARGYRDQLAKDMYYTPAGQMFDPQSQLEHLNVRVAARNNGPDLDATIARVKELLPKASDQTRPMLERDIVTLQSFKDAGGISKNPGHMYEVNINARPEQFLDWDKPLSEQSPEVAASLEQMVKSRDRMPSEWIASSPGAESNMREAGIPGIRYLDQGSRGAGEGSRNYVVFDDRLIDIIRKYGLAGAVSLGAISQQQADQISGPSVY